MLCGFASPWRVVARRCAMGTPRQASAAVSVAGLAEPPRTRAGRPRRSNKWFQRFVATAVSATGRALDRKVRTSLVSVLIALYTYTDKTGRRGARPGQARLAHQCACHRSTIGRALVTLQELGLVT